MIYDADPTPFQVERTIGIVFSLEGAVNNDTIFGLSRSYAFNTNWRIQTNTSGGGTVTFGRQENDLGQFPTLIPSATPGSYIMVIRHVSLTQHEFYINSYESPIIINPQDGYYSSLHARIAFGRILSSRSEVAATIGPLFDTFSLIPLTKLKDIMLFWSAKTGIPVS